MPGFSLIRPRAPENELEVFMLVVSNDPHFQAVFKSEEIKEHFEIRFCGKKDNIFNIILENKIKIAILDSTDDEPRDFKLLKLIKTFDPIIEVIIVGNPAASDKMIEWVARGATDYLIKPLEKSAVQLILQRLEERISLKKETYLLEQVLEKKYLFHGLVGKSPFMLEIYSFIENIAKYFSTVLITGETGTGKELVAKAIWKLSPAEKKKFVVCDVAAIPDNLFESELFGYVRGAFTGADKEKKGLFEEAHEGVIFLDEIGDIPAPVQAKFLRVLETQQFRPLGSNESRSVQFRVVAATNRDLRESVNKKTFREDLFHRLSMVEIHLPPLRGRQEDIPLLVRHFMRSDAKKFGKDIKGCSRNVQKLFLSYSWPGNVRELKNVVESAMIQCQKDFIDVADLPKYLQTYAASKTRVPFFNRADFSSLKQLEVEYIASILKANNNNIRKAAQILGISRSTLYEKINKFQIRVEHREG